MSEYETNGEDNGDEERVRDWEMGLPSVDDLTPLSQPLIPPELASAFSISPEPYRTLIDVHRASRNTLLSLGGGSNSNSNNNSNNNFKSFTDDEEEEDDGGDSNNDTDRVDGSESRKLRKLDGGNEEAECVDDQSARTVKRPRLVWTPQLHKRFVDVVGHLGIKIAVPKTIMQLMNVEGLTRENVASHLQKYRLYLKRMQGGASTEALSASDQLFASTPVPQSLQDSGGGGGGGMQMMQVPVYGHHLGMQMGNQYHHHRHHGGFEASYYPQHRVAPNDNK